MKNILSTYSRLATFAVLISIFSSAVARGQINKEAFSLPADSPGPQVFIGLIELATGVGGVFFNVKAAKEAGAVSKSRKTFDSELETARKKIYEAMGTMTFEEREKELVRLGRELDQVQGRAEFFGTVQRIQSDIDNLN